MKLFFVPPGIIPSFANFSVGVIAEDNKLMLELDAPYVLTTDFVLEQWNHVVVTYQGSNDNSGGEVKTYINGALKSTIDVILTFENSVSRDEISLESAMNIVIGKGHHRIIATKVS